MKFYVKDVKEYVKKNFQIIHLHFLQHQVGDKGCFPLGEFLRANMKGRHCIGLN